MNRTRRGRHEGSIYQRKDGRWCAAVSGGYDSDGRHVRRYIYGKKKTDVSEQIATLKQDVKKPRRVKRPSVETLESFLKTWLEEVVKPRVRASTHACYETMVRLHVLPHVRAIPLDKFDIDEVQRLQATLRAVGDSPRVQRLVHTVLHSALRNAVRTQKIAKNPSSIEFVDAPRYKSKEMSPLTMEQAQALLEAARGDRLEALFVLAVTTGMRSGELFALGWDDVNLNEATLSVRHSLQVVNGKMKFEAPKTDAGRRRISLTAVAVAALRNHRKRLLAEGLAACPFVFPSRDGTPLQRRNVTRRVFEPLLKKANLPRIRFHDLRHTAATLMLEQGVDARTIQRMLGHSDVALTLRVYGHPTEGMQREAAARLDVVFSGIG